MRFFIELICFVFCFIYMLKYTLLFLFSIAYGQMYPISNKFMNEQIVQHKYITLQYNDKAEQARWVWYSLNNSMLKDNFNRKQTSFREDPLVHSKTATNSDYRNSNYDKGHLCPANDMEFDMLALNECFYLSNVAPQEHSVNAGVWKEIELAVHKWAVHDTLWICTGTIVTKDCKRIGKNKVAVPTHFWKAVYSVKKKACIAFLVPNTACKASIDRYVLTTTDLEKLTELNFWADVYMLKEDSKNINMFFE